jgi:hypothetical protein
VGTEILMADDKTEAVADSPREEIQDPDGSIA